MITEIYVPRARLAGLHGRGRARTSASNGVPIIYGTVRLIERDDESFLPWATRAVRLHHLQPARRAHAARASTSAAAAFRAPDRPGDRARRQLLPHLPPLGDAASRSRPCYPQFPEFLRLKQQHDPEERFQSDWYRHYRTMFADAL